jgi:hypothetical protein
MNHQTPFRVLLTAVLIFAALFPSSHVLAQWSTDPNVNNPICTTSSRYRSDLKMASDGAGGAFLTWTGQTSPTGLPGISLDVYAQRIDSSGLLPWGGEEAVLANNRLDQRLPFITSDDSGGANITWGVRPFNPGYQNSQTFGQRLGANGAPHWAVGGEFLAATDGDMYYYVPVSTSDGGGGVITAFQYGVGSSSFLMSTRIKASGVVQPINGFWDGLADQRSLAINSDGVGGAIVAWALSSNIYAQRIDTSGVVHWNTNGVAILTGGSQRGGVPPAIMSDGAGGAIIAWLDSRTSYGIYAQRVDSAGVVRWTTNGVPVTTAARISSYNPPALVSDNAGGAIIAWRDSSNGVGIRVQRLSNAGVVLWDSNGVAIAPTPSLAPNNAPAMVADGAGGTIITWSDARNGASNTDIYAQRLDAFGVVQWTTNGVAISTAAGNQTAPQIVTNGTGGAIIAWLDLRNAGPSLQPAEVYGQRVNANGQLGGTTDALDNNPATPGVFKLNQSYPNPFNPTTTFTFNIPHTANVRLGIYNVLGQEVATVVNETLPAGSYSRTFNAAGLASGAYFYRLTAGEYSETTRMLLLK